MTTRKTFSWATLAAVAVLPAGMVLAQNPSQPENQGRSQRTGQQRTYDREQIGAFDRERQDQQRDSGQDLRTARTHYQAGYQQGYRAGYWDAQDDYVLYIIDAQKLRQQQRSQGDRERGSAEDESMRRGLREQIQREGQQRSGEQGAASASGAGTQQVRGEVLRTTHVPLRNSNREHVLALIESDQGARRVVDLGPSSDLRNVNLREGAQVSAQGQFARTRDNVPILLAQRLSAGGRTISIDRQTQTSGADQQRQTYRSASRMSQAGDRSDQTWEDWGSGRPPARTINIVAEGMDFHPAEIRVRPGEKFRLELINRGERVHNIELHLPNQEVSLQQNVQPGNQGDVVMTAPSEPGEYIFYCPVANHRERGMTGRLIVEGESRSVYRQ